MALRRRLAVRLLIMTGAVVLAGMLYVAVVAPTPAVGQAPDVAYLYQAADYAGPWTALGVDGQDPDLTNNTVRNDTASSLEIVDPSCTVRLYEHTNYAGKSITFDTNIRDLRVYNWNDIASSVKVYCV